MNHKLLGSLWTDNMKYLKLFETFQMNPTTMNVVDPDNNLLKKFFHKKPTYVDDEKQNVQNCTFKSVEFSVGDMILLNIDLISKSYPLIAIKLGPISRDIQYEIIEITKKKTYQHKHNKHALEQFYDIHIFNNNDYVQVPIQCVYKELESTMTKYNL